MGAKHIKTQARKLNKYILYILIGLVLLMAIFAIPKTSMEAFAWQAPGHSWNFRHIVLNNTGGNNANDPQTSMGSGNFDGISDMTLSNIGLYNLYDTSYTQVGTGVNALHRLKAQDLEAAGEPDLKEWENGSAWLAHSSKAWVCNFGSGQPSSFYMGDYTDLSGHYFYNKNTHRTILFTTIKLSPEIISGLKNGTIEIIFSAYGENKNYFNDTHKVSTNQYTGSFITLGKYEVPEIDSGLEPVVQQGNKYVYDSTSWRDLHNFKTIYGNDQGDAYYQILDAPGGTQRATGVGGLGNLYNGGGRSYFVSKLGHDNKAYPTGDGIEEYDSIRIGMYFIDGMSLTTKIINSGMYNMQLEIRSKAQITVTFDNQEKEYGDPNPAMTATVTGLIGSDTVTSVIGSYSCDATSPVGSYTGSATGYTLTNGNQAYYPNVTFVNTSPTLTVNQRNISITSQSLSKFYGAADPTHTYTVTSGSVVNGDTIGQITRASGETVNTYAYFLTSPNSNYNITFTSTNFTINKRPVTITPDALSKIQGNLDPPLTYATDLGSWAPLTGSWADFNGELSRDPGEAPGTYNILQNDLTNINNSNYDITFTSGVKFTITSSKAIRTITYTGPSSLQYNGSLQAFTGATLSHSDDNDTLSYSNNTFTDVPAGGKLNFTISAPESTNYQACSLDVEVSVTKIAITVTIGDKGSAYGADIVTLTSSVTSGSLAGGQDADKTHVEVLNLTLSTTAKKTSNVGTYPISGLYNNGNYAVTFSGSYTDNTTKGTYTIGKASVTATISAASKTYGQNDPTFDFVVNSGLVNGDEKAALGITLERVNTSNAVGEYTITKASQTNNNYEVTMTSGKLTINAKAIEIKVEDKTSVYGSSVADLSWVLNTGSSMAYSEDASTVLVINLSCAASSSSNVGKYAISGAVDGNSSKNYSISFVGTYTSDNTKGTYEITPATVDVTISNASKTYGQDDPSFGFTVTSGLVNPDTASSLGLTLVRANSTVQTVGTYAITKDSHTNNNYLVNVTQDGVFTINAKAIEVKVEDKTSVYGQAVVDLSWVLNTGSSMAYSEDASTVLVINLACGVTTSSPRGTYPITGTVDENSSDNYSISFVGTYASDNTKGTYEISQRGVTVKANSDSRIYWSMKQEDETYSATITYAGDFDPATAGEGIVAVNVVLERENGEDVNTYSILASADMVANNPNYDITFTAGTYKITKFNISITPTTGQSKTYGDADPATYTYEDLIYPAGTGYATLVGALGRAAGEDVNTYAYNIDSFKAVDNPNYNITLVEGKTFAINRKSVTITPTASLSKQYGNLDPELTFGNNLGEWKASSGSWAAITGVLSRIPGETVNTYAITQGEVTNANNGNYDITFVDSVVFTIARRDVTITPDANQGKEYYSCLQADESALTYTHTSLKDANFVDFTPDVLDGKLARVEGEDAGDYTISEGSLINANNGNYNITVKSGVKYVISKFVVTVKADSGKTKRIGTDDPEFTYTVNRTPATLGYTAITGSLTRKPGETAGTYEILQGSVDNDNNQNYDITFVSELFTITSKLIRTLEYTGPESLVYNGISQSFEGAQLSHLDDDNTITYSANNTFTNVPEGNTLTFMIYGAESTNYAPCSLEVTVTVTKIALTVTIGDKGSLYGADIVALTSSVTTGSLAGGQDAGKTHDVVLGLTLSTTATKSSNVGTYPISGKYTSGNYDVTFSGSYASDNTKGTYEISQRGVTVKANSDSRIYWSMKQEDETYSATITYAGDFDPATAGEGIVAVNVVLERENGEDVNTYSILASVDMVANNPNYDITFTAGTYEITKFNISITPTTGQSKTYGDADPATYTYEDLIYPAGTGYATLVGALGRAAGEDVNTYAYNIDSFKAVDNPNYNITLVEGKTFAINRKSVTITPTALSKQYGNLDSELTFGNNLGEWKASSGSWAAITGVLSRIPGETVNTYAITQGEVTNANNGNYDITFVDSVVFTIARRDVTITPDANQGKEYYSCLQADESALTYTHTSLKDVSFADFTPDVLDGKLARVEGEDAGNYLINLGTLINYNNPNYNLNIDAVNYVISKFKVQVTADSGKEKVYGEVDPVFTYTTDSMPVVEGYKALEGALTRKNLTIQTVGDYQILQGTLTNTKNSNYDITFVSASFQITKKAVTITPDTLFKQYGNLDPALTYSAPLGEWKADETGSWAVFVGQLSRNDGEIVGEYGILPGTLVEYNNPNYDINFIDTIKFTITRRDVTITPNSNQSKEYYEYLQVAESDLTYTHSALKDANFESFTPKALEGTLARAEGEDAGDYLINLGTLTNDKNSNYNISIETEYYVIRPFEVEITPNSGQEKVYGEVDPVFAYTTDRMPAIEGYKALEGKLTRANIDEQNAGNYQILQGNLTNVKNSNYNITFSVSVVTFKINPKSIEIKIADKSSVEGDEPVQLTWTLNDGFSMAYEENAETELIITLVAIDVTSSSTVGEYEIIGTVEANSSNNYLITFVGNHIDGDKGIYTIIAAMLLNPVFNLSYFNTHIYTYTGETQTVGSGAVLEIGTANQKANITYSNNTFTTVSEGNALLVKVSVEADGEYNAYSATFRIKVQKAETQINLSSMKTVFTYNGQLQTASGAKVNHLENANITYENNTFTTVSEGNGKVVKIKAAATANYKAKETTVTLTVNKATYDFSHCTFEDQEKEYNCEEQMIEIEGKLPVGFDGSKPKVEYIGSLKDVGCVEVKVKITSISENYMIPEIDAERCAMLTICKKRITISVKPFLAIENKKYNFEFDIDGLQGTDTMEIFDVKPEVEGYGTSIKVEAGRYTVEPFGASASNYEISYLPYTLIVHKENLTSDLGNNVNFTITGYYDPSFQLEVTPDKDFEFDDPLSKILHIVQKSYKVRVVGGEGLELPESIKLIYRDNTLKSSILNRAYWINENGEKINLSAKDVVKEGFLETKFAGESGELIIYKDYTVIYIIASVSTLVFLVVLYLIYREYRDKKKQAAQKAEATEEARKANIRKNVKSKEDKQPKVEEDKNKTVELKDQKDLPKTEESKDSNEKKNN